MGNAVTPIGIIKIVDDNGHSAYHFDTTNSIKSEAEVSANYTFLIIFRRLNPMSMKGRFFTGTTVSCLFGSFQNYYKNWMAGGNPYWVYERYPAYGVADSSMQFYIGINDNGVKDMFDIGLDFQIARNITHTGTEGNQWGHLVIGKPEIYDDQAADVYVYEALGFDRAVTESERNLLSMLFKTKYPF